MEEQIIKILENESMGYTDDTQRCAEKIAEHFEKFLVWVTDIRYPFYRYHDNWKKFDEGNVLYTNDQLFNYWLININK